MGDDAHGRVTWLGSTAALIPFVVGLIGYVLLSGKGWRPAVFLAAALAGAIAWYQIVKPLVGRPRPPAALHLVPASGFAFPSGHATAAIAVWGAVAIVLSVGRPTRWKVAIGIVAGVIVTLVAVSRVYLGVHWWTDAVGGLALGGAWLCLLVIAGLVSSRADLTPRRPTVPS